MSVAVVVLGIALQGGLVAAVEGAGQGGEARILVVTDAPDADAASVRAEELYAGLRAAGLLPVSIEERAGVDLPLVPDAQPGSRDGVRASLQEARARLRELDAPGARAAADLALDELVRLERPEDALDLFADVLLFRASLALTEERADDARADLLLLSRLEPARTELHPGLYPPSLVDAYAAARADPADDARATLVVRARAAAFVEPRVLVDARPWAGGSLAPGPHLVTVRAEGSAPRSELRVLDPATPTILEPFLAPLGAGAVRTALVLRARAARLPQERARALGALAEQCAARVVVFEHGSTLELFTTGAPLRKLTPPARDGVTVGRVVLAALQPPSRGGDRVLPEDGSPSPALVWGAVAVGAGVLALGAAGGVLAWALWPAEPPPAPARPVVIYGLTD